MLVHSTASKIDVFPDEFIPIMKAIKFATLSNDFTDHVVDQKALDTLNSFLDYLSDTALNEAA